MRSRRLRISPPSGGGGRLRLPRLGVSLDCGHERELVDRDAGLRTWPVTGHLQRRGDVGSLASGTAIVAGETFTVTQSQGGAYVVQPASSQVWLVRRHRIFQRDGESRCDWSAASNDS